MSGRTFLATILALVIGSVLLLGCRPRDHAMSASEKRAAWVVEKISDELDLNERQKATLNRIKGEVLAKQEDFKGIYSGLVDEVLAQVKSDKVDEGALNKTFQDREQKLREIRSFLVSKFGEFHGTLTPEQQKTLADKLERYRKHRG